MLTRNNLRKLLASASVALFVCIATSGRNIAKAQGPAGHDLQVKVTDIKGTEGQIIIALFTKPDGFPADIAKADHVAKVNLAGPTHSFQQLAGNAYVVVVFHDRNENGKVDKSLLGFPQEPIGLSNHNKIGPPRPDFEKAKIDVTKTREVTINLIEIGR